MANGFTVTLDAARPTRLAEFWALALGYVLEPPPAPFTSWPEALTAWGVPESSWEDYSAIVDPDGTGPRVFLQRVPEPKTAKNRVHLDVHAPGTTREDLDVKRSACRAHAETLVAAGAEVEREFDDPQMGFWIVMHDPEGNEFCVV